MAALLLGGFVGCSLVAPLEDVDVAGPDSGGSQSGGDAGAPGSSAGGNEGDPGQAGGSSEGGSAVVSMGGAGGEAAAAAGGVAGESSGAGGAGGAEIQPCQLSTDCDDDNDCTDDRCESQICVHINENAPGVDCDDKNPCTTTDKCVPNTGVCQGNTSCDDNEACTDDDKCTAQGTCVGISYQCPGGVTPSSCNGAGACVCPVGYGRLCVPPNDPSLGCYPECCPGELDQAMTCNGGTHTSRCTSEGTLICIPP